MQCVCMSSEGDSFDVNKEIFIIFTDILVDAEYESYDSDTGDSSNLHFIFAYKLLPWAPFRIIGNDSITAQNPVSLEG